MRYSWWNRRRRAGRPRNHVAFALFVAAIAAGLYLAGVGIAELWLLLVAVVWVAFLRG